MFRRTSLNEIEMNQGVLSLIGFQQIGKKSRGERRENPDPDCADFTTPRCTRVLQSIFDAPDSKESMIQKSCARVSERHATRMSDKQRDAHLMFQIADASADSRFPNAKFNGCLPKAMFLCGSQYIAQILQHDFGGRVRRNAHPSPSYPTLRGYRRR
ncbi:MAG TPA: hypothetical protein VNN81_12365 [Bradyrhizobium sp.]|jgi:hypothetical protein|nr:hypothetical protein [Bradyrhizobium sp.]